MGRGKARQPAKAAGKTSLHLRIDFDGDRSIGPGKVRLLELVNETGSISAAGRALAMSYRQAWLLIDELNRMCRAPVVIAQTGGGGGGGAVLTETGNDIVRLYRRNGTPGVRRLDAGNPFARPPSPAEWIHAIAGAGKWSTARRRNSAPAACARRIAITGSPTWKSPCCGGARGLNSARSGLRSISGVPSRQSRPRTEALAPRPSRAARYEVSDEIGPYRRSQREDAACPTVAARALQREIATQLVQLSRAPPAARTRRCRPAPCPTAQRPRCGRSARQGGPAAGSCRRSIQGVEMRPMK